MVSAIINKLYNFITQKGFKRYFLNTGWLLTERVIRMCLNFFVGVWVARYLGPERLGLLSYAQSFVGLFLAFSTLGLNTIVIRDLVKEEKNGPLLGTTFGLKLIGSFLVFLTLAIAINFTQNNSFENLLIFIIASSTLFQSFNVIDFYFQSKVLSRYVVYSNIITLGVSSILKVILILNNAPLITFAYVVLWDSFILSIGYIYFYLKNKLSFKSWRFDLTLAKTLLKESWPLILSSVVISIYMKIDQVMIKSMLNNEAVGQYAVAVKISETLYFLPMVISSSLFPAIIKAKKLGARLYQKRLVQLYAFVGWLAIGIALPITFVGTWLINFLYGADYALAGNVLLVHIWAALFVFWGVANSKWLLIENLQIYYMINTTLGAIVNIVLNLFLIKSLGIMGAAWSTIISYAISSYFGLAFYKKTRSSFIQITKSLTHIKSIFYYEKTNKSN